ncbi:MAG: ORF6N domain-containing protein [bacterium]
MNKNEFNKFDDVGTKIITIREQQIIIDSDLSVLYGVETRDINKAVKNNPDKFPKGYVFELTKKEKNELVENFHHLNHLKYSSASPKAFTEKGLYMLATILKSNQATKTTIAIIETFAKVKSLNRAIREFAYAETAQRKKSLIQKSNEIISELIDDNLQIEQSETTIELNFALLKVKHTIKRK